MWCYTFKQVYFYDSTTWANEPIRIMCWSNSLSLPVMHSACWHLQASRSYFHIISLGQGDMAWIFSVFPTILPCICSKVFHGIKIRKTNTQSIVAQESILGFCCSVTKSCLTLCDSLNCSRPGFPVLHDLSESAQVHVHWVSDAI